jgi:hypothetical protein
MDAAGVDIVKPPAKLKFKRALILASRRHVVEPFGEEVKQAALFVHG